VATVFLFGGAIFDRSVEDRFAPPTVSLPLRSTTVAGWCVFFMLPFSSGRA
jgi:hypothetical protein